MTRGTRNLRRWRRRFAFGAVGVGTALVGVVLAQTFPGTAAPGNPFEVHGLLYSGSAPAGSLLGDGWAQGSSFRGVLDENGNPTIDPLGNIFRASLNVDPNWGNQGDGDDPTLFSGSNKNYDLIGFGQDPWEWGFGAGGPQKNDITNSYFHTRVDPLTGDRWVFVAAETRSTNGDSHVDFEFNQAGVVPVGGPSGHVVGMGPDGGRTINDFMISVDFEQGGSHPVATVRWWNGAEFLEVSVPDAVFSATNLFDIPHGAAGDWKHFADDGAAVNTLTHRQFVEGAANLSLLGVAVDPCRTDATFSAKTRSSTSWSSDLKDFVIAQFPLEPMPQLVITAPDAVCNQNSFDASVVELTGLSNTSLLWEVSGCGRLASDPTANKVVIATDAVCGCAMRLSVTAVGGECAHRVVASVDVNVGDEAAPALSSEPADATVECDSIPAPSTVTATDDCSEVGVVYAEEQTPGACEGEAVILRAWGAADSCENTTTHMQTLTVTDTQAPALLGVPGDTQASCDNIPAPAEVSATDNCSEPLVELSEATTTGPCIGEATIRRTWTALDACGNESPRTQTITVYDDAAPELLGVPADDRVECDAIPAPANVSATDNCSDTTVSLDEIVTPGQCEGDAGIHRTWTAWDDCGNETSKAQVIAVEDTTPPILAGVPSDAVVECSAIPEPSVVTATDNCSEPTVELTESLESAGVPGKGSMARSWTAVDSCGNETTQTQILTIVDTISPVLHGVPEDSTVECDAIPPPPDVTVTDNCATPAVVYSERIEPGPCQGQWTIIRTWTAADDCQNPISESQIIHVIDTRPPTLGNLPSDIITECDAVPTAALVTAADTCSDVVLRMEEISEPGDCEGSSTITRTWTAADACGNQAFHVQVLTVVDTTAPTLNNDPADAVVECDNVPRPANLGASDNCDSSVPVNLSEQNTPGSCDGEYTVDRTWTATDDCGNSGVVAQRLAVQDTTAPRITLSPGGKQFICDGRPVVYNVQSTDNCSSPVLTMDRLTSITANSRDRVTATLMPDGSVRITVMGPALVMGEFTAADDCGNASDAFRFKVTAELGQEACSQGFWRNHPERWPATGFSPDMPFIEAFGITDLSSPEIPSGFDTGISLIDAANMTGGSFNQALLQGVAALLNAAHPGIEYPWTVAQVQSAMQAAFAGEITFQEAVEFFNLGNAAERECGCPIQ